MTIAVVHQNTDEGRTALRLAAQEALTHDTDLLVLHVLSGAPAGVEAPRASEEGAVRRAVGQAVGHDLGPQGPSWRLLVSDPDPDVAGALLALVEQEAPDRLVVGARRRSPVGKLLLGQQLQKLLLAVDVPVLLVKPPTR